MPEDAQAYVLIEISGIIFSQNLEILEKNNIQLTESKIINFFKKSDKIKKSKNYKAFINQLICSPKYGLNKNFIARFLTKAEIYELKSLQANSAKEDESTTSQIINDVESYYSD